MTRTNVSLKNKKPSREKFISPYNLNAGNINSNNFYEDLEAHTSVVINKGIKDLGNIIDDYRSVSKDKSPVTEVLLDMMIMGVLWHEYAGLSIPFLKIKKAILIFLYNQRKHSSLKNSVDSLRGKLATNWLTVCKKRKKEISIKELNRLMLFLEATCEYREELKRASRILQYLEETDRVTAEDAMSKIVDFTSWFKFSSDNYLGRYTADVSEFLHKYHGEYKGREDYFFCGRKESEYHLNMAGAEIMNRTLRKEFENTKEKILLLPTCMSSQNSKCKAMVIKGDLTCVNCNHNCTISRTTLDMKQKGIRTVLIRHSSSFSKCLEPCADQKTIGLIGVACVLNLLTGGFEMKRLGIPSQCVFLDHPGCKKHWRSGKPSDINPSAVCKMACMKENVICMHQ